MHILIFGDSITFGAWDSRGGWVQRLRVFIESRDPKHEKYTLVYNCGVSDDTTSDILERFEREAKARLDDDEDIVVIFSIGTNDCLVNGKRFQVDEKTFRKNIKSLIKSARKFSDRVYFTGLTPVDEPKMNPLKWAPQFSAKNSFIEKYDSIIRSACREEVVPFIEMFTQFKKIKYEKFLDDGDHPNSKGHEKIFRIMKDFLANEKII